MRKLKALPVEAVVRGYLIGSGWKDYLSTGQVCGIRLPAGLRESDRLPEPIFTPAFKNAVRAVVDRTNADLSVIEKVRQFAFADEAFTIENEEMTPSMKIRRHKIRERYGARLDALYKA